MFTPPICWQHLDSKGNTPNWQIGVIKMINTNTPLHTILYTNKGSFRARVFTFCSVLVVFSLILLYSLFLENTTTEIQEGISSEIIRFHVIANSDSPTDQALKLEIKDALTEALRPTLEKAGSVEEARLLLTSNLKDMETLSNSLIKKHGYSYTATASLERGFFPLKAYGDITLPPGEYEAIRIELGEATGKNWWCIMYPPLCYVDATYRVVPEHSKDQLKYVLTEDEYKAILSQKDVKVKVKFKLLPWLND